MRKILSFSALMLGCVVVTSGAVVASVNDEKTSSAEKLLSGKGLTKDDRKFLLEEAPAVEKYEQAKSVYANYQKALNRYAKIAQYDEGVQNLEMERQSLQEQANALQMQINSANSSGYGRMRNLVNAQLAPMRQQENQIKAGINQINTQIQASKSQGPKPDERKAVPAEVERTRLAYVDSVRELDEVASPLLAKYHELALDKSVTDALAQLRHSTTHNYKLGPSDQLVAASKMIHDVKKHTTGTHKTASKKKAKVKGS